MVWKSVWILGTNCPNSTGRACKRRRRKTPSLQSWMTRKSLRFANFPPDKVCCEILCSFPIWKRAFCRRSEIGFLEVGGDVQNRRDFPSGRQRLAARRGRSLSGRTGQSCEQHIEQSDCQEEHPNGCQAVAECRYVKNIFIYMRFVANFHWKIFSIAFFFFVIFFLLIKFSRFFF